MITGFVTFSATNAAQPLLSAAGIFGGITVWGYSSFSTGIPVNNASSAYLGINTGFLPIKITAGSSFSMSPTNKDNIANYYAAGASGDGVFFYAW